MATTLKTCKSAANRKSRKAKNVDLKTCTSQEETCAVSIHDEISTSISSPSKPTQIPRPEESSKLFASRNEFPKLKLSRNSKLENETCESETCGNRNKDARNRLQSNNSPKNTKISKDKLDSNERDCLKTGCPKIKYSEKVSKPKQNAEKSDVLENKLSSVKCENLTKSLAPKYSLQRRVTKSPKSEHAETLPHQTQERRLQESNKHEFGTKTKVANSKIPRLKKSTRTTSTQTYIKMVTQSTQTPDSLSFKDNLVHPNPKQWKDIKSSAESSMKRYQQAGVSKAKKRVSFEDCVYEDIIEWNHDYNEPLRKSPLSYSITQLCGESEATEPEYEEKQHDLHWDNASTQPNDTLNYTSSNPELGLMGALGLTSSLSKSPTKNSESEEYESVTNSEIFPQKPARGILRSCLKRTPQLSPSLSPTEDVSKEQTSNSVRNDLSPDSGLSSLCDTPQHDTDLDNNLTGVYMTLKRHKKFKISINDVVSRYRSVNNCLIRMSVEMAEMLGIESVPHLTNSLDGSYDLAEEAFVFYGGCGDSLHYLTTNCWRRTLKLYSCDDISGSVVRCIVKNKALDSSKIIRMWNLGIMKIWYFTYIDMSSKVAELRNSRGMQRYDTHKYVLTNMKNEGLPLCRQSMNYFITHSKLLMEMSNRTSLS
ncbi:hypothetical protein Ahia01_000875800 [Argonauta hians]